MSGPKSTILRFKSAVLGLKVLVSAARIHNRIVKYRPDQPRVPKGDPDGGQWTYDGSMASARVAGRFDPKRADACDAQMELDSELCSWRRALSAGVWQTELLPVLRTPS